jgi:hypothetical protein
MSWNASLCLRNIGYTTLCTFERNQQPSIRSSIYSIDFLSTVHTDPPAILSQLPFLRNTSIALLRIMPTAILPTSPRAINKQTMSTMPSPKTKTNFGAGGKALPDTYKYVPFFFYLADERSTGNEAIDTMAFLHLLEQLKVCSKYGFD